jgi:putative phosphoserine phosphatase/1-acylglycerol-3-phosphate O-acyltransferase
MGADSLPLTYSIETGPSGPEVAAFFDLDGTLVAGVSALAFVRDRVASGQFMLQDIADLGLSAVSFRRGGLGFSGMMAALARMLRNTPEGELVETGQCVFEEQLAPLVYADARLLVEAHRAQGHTLAIVSAATRYQTGPVARELGVDNVLCTQLEVKGGRLTGRVVQPACWGDGKLRAAREFSRERGVDLGKSYFYSDGYEDVPLLEAVGHPRPTNPERDLDRLARSRAWPVLNLDHSAPPTRLDQVRTAAALALAPSATLSSAAAALLSERFRTPLNLCVGGWSEALTRIAGVELRVRGRRFLGSARPAIFMFNSQSALDGLIVGRLLKRDFAPLVAPRTAESAIYRAVASLAKTAFVEEPASPRDGAARDRALAALSDGISLVASVEKSRGPPGRLGPFRTAPFRLALDAGVPVVPIVIRNSAKTLPAGAIVVRSGRVDVEVVRPIPTEEWTRRTLRRETAVVRSLFLKALGEPLKP